MSTRTVETTARQFKALVEPVLPLAAQDPSLPILNGIKLNTMGGKLVAYATDRYRLGLQVSDIEAKTFDALLPVSAVKQILRIYRAAKTYDAPLTLSSRKGDDGKTRIKVTGLTGDKYIPTVTMSIEQPDGEYPKLLTLFRDALKRTPAVEQIFNVQLLSGFAPATRISRGQATFILAEDPKHPMQIRAGDDFLGLIAPARNMSSRPTAPMGSEWASRIEQALTAAGVSE